jgi:hypothetical protein
VACSTGQHDGVTVGHIRLGQLPRTRKWRDVVELVAVGADVSQVANATIRAADSAFSFVNNDSGYNQSVWLMTQLGLAAGEKDPLKYLRSQGIDIPDNTSLPGVAAAITQAWTIIQNPTAGIPPWTNSRNGPWWMP